MNKFGEWLFEIKHVRKKLVISLIFLIIAGAFYGIAGDYVSERANTVVSSDIILDNIGPYNLIYVFVWLFLLIIAIFILYPLIFKPLELPYVINMLGLFVIVRSAFVMFTHLRPPPDSIHIVFPGFLQLFNFSNDMFFSGHAGLPFLGFLIFREHHKGLGYFMLASSIVLGVTVLLMHVHYSIDVFSAFFITYGIYVMGNKLVKKLRIPKI